MTDEQRHRNNLETLKHVEKSAWKSKKFKFGFFVEVALIGIVFKALMTYNEVNWPLAVLLMLVVFTMGAIALVFNGYQAALDKYVRGAALVGSIGEERKGMLEKMFGGGGKGDGGEE